MQSNSMIRIHIANLQILQSHICKMRQVSKCVSKYLLRLSALPNAFGKLMISHESKVPIQSHFNKMNHDLYILHLEKKSAELEDDNKSLINISLFQYHSLHTLCALHSTYLYLFHIFACQILY